jgi:hypothetical protein
MTPRLSVYMLVITLVTDFVVVVWLPKLIMFFSFLVLGQNTSNCFAGRTFADLLGLCLSRYEL